MKKPFLSCIFICFALSLTGCNPGNILTKYIASEDSAPETGISDAPRVYMDEIRGSVQAFTGNELTILSEGKFSTFDVSQASLECKNGIISGDEVSLIYEGQLSQSDPSSVKVLKVVDEINKKTTLEDRTAHGKVLDLTPNTITIQAKSGKKATYPITGTEQYYQSGVKAGSWVYLHFMGKFPSSQPDDPNILNASLLKVTSISDIDPLVLPSPTPTPDPKDEEQEKEKQFQAVVQNIKLNSLSLLPNGAETPVSIDLSSIPVYFKGGAAPGSHVTVSYTGEFNGTTTEGITIKSVTGENPDTLNDYHMSFTVSGTIVASTANTSTIQTPDGAQITCQTQDANNTSTQGMLSGSSIRVTFNPAASRTSNIYKSLKIEDA